MAYSRSSLFLACVGSLAAGRIALAAAVGVFLASLLLGHRSYTTGHMEPSLPLFVASVVLGFIWFSAIGFYLLSALLLPCDSCRRRYVWCGLVPPRQYSSSTPRNQLARFFRPDELVDRRYKCPHCHGEFTLG